MAEEKSVVFVSLWRVWGLMSEGEAGALGGMLRVLDFMLKAMENH